MNISSDFAKKGILLMWLGAVGIVVYKEFGNYKNEGRPLPRPCKFIPASIGYTGLGLMAEFVPSIAFLVAIGVTISELISDAGVYGTGSTILNFLSGSINKETQAVGAA